jgi:hypothetical protein
MGVVVLEVGAMIAPSKSRECCVRGLVGGGRAADVVWPGCLAGVGAIVQMDRGRVPRGFGAAWDGAAAWSIKPENWLARRETCGILERGIAAHRADPTGEQPCAD